LYSLARAPATGPCSRQHGGSDSAPWGSTGLRFEHKLRLYHCPQEGIVRERTIFPRAKPAGVPLAGGSDPVPVTGRPQNPKRSAHPHEIALWRGIHEHHESISDRGRAAVAAAPRWPPKKWPCWRRFQCQHHDRRGADAGAVKQHAHCVPDVVQRRFLATPPSLKSNSNYALFRRPDMGMVPRFRRAIPPAPSVTFCQTVSLVRLLLPLRLQHAGIFSRGIEGELEPPGIELAIRLQLHVAPVQGVGVAMVIAEKLLGQ